MVIIQESNNGDLGQGICSEGDERWMDSVNILNARMMEWIWVVRKKKGGLRMTTNVLA